MALLGLFLSSLAACGKTEPRPRNAILISIDTLRPDFLSCYGHPRETSPALDALAARGVRFTDVTAAAPWTLPSHATMLTGLYPRSHGVKSHETRLSASIETLAEALVAGGFQTFAAVNTHNIGAPQFQLQQGFERFEYVSETHKDAKGRIQTPNTGPEAVAAAQKFLGARQREKPFFLFLHLYDAHTDFTPKKEWKETFVEPYSGKITGRSQQLHGIRNRNERLDEGSLRFLRQMYEAEIRQVDELLADFFAWLRSEGLYDQTLIVVTSDHGEEFEEHGGLLHGRSEYQEVMHVPLIVCGPGVPAGRVVETAVHGVDVTPTILAALGVRSKQAHDGLDLAPAWRGGTLPARTFFGEADHNNMVNGKEVSDIKKMVRRGNEKLLYDTHTRESELFDLDGDPLEKNNLAAAQPARATELLAELERYLATSVRGESIAPPTESEQSLLDALGYGGGLDDEDQGTGDARQ